MNDALQTLLAIGAVAGALFAGFAARSAEAAADAARDTARSTRELVEVEQSRRADEVRAASSSRGFVARRQARTGSQVRVIRIFNRGPGSATIGGLAVVLENGQPLPPDTEVVLSDELPLTLHRGEYIRVDVTPAGQRECRVDVHFADVAGSHSQRVRVLSVDEPEVPIE